MTGGDFLVWLSLLQGLYYSISGIWPLLSIDTFMAVTGPKTDIWLVKTVGVLLMGSRADRLLDIWFAVSVTGGASVNPAIGNDSEESEGIAQVELLVCVRII